MKALQAARRGETPVADTACRDWLQAPDTARIAADLEWLAAKDHQLLSFDNPDFPALLRDSAGAPAALFVVGDATALWRAQVAIVGSRSASHAGLRSRAEFCARARRGGLRDHERTCRRHRRRGARGGARRRRRHARRARHGTRCRLSRQASASSPRASQRRGALVSEFPPGTPGRPENFPRRNRIIAGLALGTLVVEAGLRSGSLITARCASEQGRDVFAIPGSIHNPLARGCHRLIRQGAALVESAEEIVEGLAPLAQRLGAHLRDRLDSGEPGDSLRSARMRGTGPVRARPRLRPRARGARPRSTGDRPPCRAHGPWDRRAVLNVARARTRGSGRRRARRGLCPEKS